MYYNYNNVDFKDLEGKTITSIDKRDDELDINTSDGKSYRMYHRQDCCESVYIEDVIGDLDDLIDSPITMAEEVTEEFQGGYDSGTWTFYKLATNKGYVTLRWLGTSNGYYSERVDFVELTDEEDMF